MVPAERLAAGVSSESSKFPASNVIDGDLTTDVVARRGTNSWVSVQVPAGTPLGYVAVYNARSNRARARGLGDFEVWVGTSMGDTSATAIKCGESTYDVNHEPNPYVLWCSGVSDRPYVTVLKVGTGILALAELVPYTIPFPSPPGLPPHLPSPPAESRLASRE